MWFFCHDRPDRLRDAELRPLNGERLGRGTVGRLLVLPHCSKEPHALTRKGLDQALLCSAVANRGPDGIDTSAQCGFRNDPSTPDCPDQVISADDAVAIADQVFQ